MNTEDKRFDPRMELSATEAVQPHWARPLVIFLTAITVVILWSLLCRNCQRMSPNPPASQGQHHSGDGSGSGSAGNGNGSGRQADGSGQLDYSGTATRSGTPYAPLNNRNQTQSVKTSTPSVAPVSSLPTNHAPQLRQVETLSRHTTAAAATAGDDKSPAGRQGFYGIEVKKLSKVLFLLDVSGSMRSASREIAGSSRLDVLKAELRKAIFGSDRLTEKSFQRSGGFILMTFANTVNRFPAENLCRYRNRSAMHKAEEYLNWQLQTSGGTMMKKAWQEAIETIKAENIDEVYFLTDGQSGDDFSLEWLLAKMRKELPERIKVHCVAVGHSQNFMRQLAQKRQGTYVYIP